MNKSPEPRCVDCGGRWLSLDDDGLCQACFVARGFRVMAQDAQPIEHTEPHHEPVIGHRLAAVIAQAALRMSPVERGLLWLECYRLLGDKIDKDTHPELCAAINALRDDVPEAARTAKWN